MEDYLVTVTWGFIGNTRTRTIKNSLAKEIWDKFPSLHSNPDYIWIFREPTEDERANYSETVD